MKFSDHRGALGSINPSVISYNVNNAFDPYGTGAGGQPHLFAQMATLYRNYLVQKVTYYAILTNQDSNDLEFASSLHISSPSSVFEPFEQATGIVKVAVASDTHNSSRAILKRTVVVRKYMPRSLYDDNQIGALVTTGPSYTLHHQFQVQEPAYLSIGLSYTFHLYSVMYVKFFNPQFIT